MGKSANVRMGESEKEGRCERERTEGVEPVTATESGNGVND
jgi:hypothetical protein